MSADTPRPERVTLSEEERLALGRHLRKRLDAGDPAERRYLDTWLQLAYAADEWFAAREQALREKIAGLKATLEQVERAVPVCTFDLYEGVCGDLVGGKFPNGAEFTEGMCCVPCRVRRIARGETR